MAIKNIPEIKVGIVVGSTDWMPSDLAMQRFRELTETYVALYGNEGIHSCAICLDDNEINIKRILKDLLKAGCNALCLYFGNYGPEHTSALLAQQFNGPVMLCGAAEDSGNHMRVDRKDAYTGLLNACYGLGLKSEKVYIPSEPVGTVDQCAKMIHGFMPVARTLLAVQNLKIISFGPRPSSYVAAYAPYHLLYDLGIEVDEYSELELFNSFEKHADDKRISKIAAEMREELGASESLALDDFAQYEATLNDWVRSHKGSKKYFAITSTCWPAFPVSFGFVPCYVNSRLTSRGVPVACEVDVYGAVSEYIGQCVSGEDVTILNYNNNVPVDIYEEQVEGLQFNGISYDLSDLFIGYHCGVTCSKRLMGGNLAPHFVNEQLIGSEKARGTLHGTIVPGPVTLFRIQGSLHGKLKAYIVEGQVLPIDAKTYGGQGVIAVSGMSRFYRNVLIGQCFPNHFALVFGHYGKELHSILSLLGIDGIEYNHPANIPYNGENPFN